MFLFKRTRSKVKRIGMNMAVYGFAGVALFMNLAFFLPEIVANYVYSLAVICAYSFIIGLIVSIVWFIYELTPFAMNKQKEREEHPATEEIAPPADFSEFRPEAMDYTEKIVLQYLFPPVHAGDCSFGYSLILHNGQWFFETSRYRAVGRGEETYRYKPLEKSFWKGDIYAQLHECVGRWHRPITPEDVVDQEKLEQAQQRYH